MFLHTEHKRQSRLGGRTSGLCSRRCCPRSPRQRRPKVGPSGAPFLVPFERNHDPVTKERAPLPSGDRPLFIKVHPSTRPRASLGNDTGKRAPRDRAARRLHSFCFQWRGSLTRLRSLTTHGKARCEAPRCVMVSVLYRGVRPHIRNSESTLY